MEPLYRARWTPGYTLTPPRPRSDPKRHIADPEDLVVYHEDGGAASIGGLYVSGTASGGDPHVLIADDLSESARESLAVHELTHAAVDIARSHMSSAEARGPQDTFAQAFDELLPLLVEADWQLASLSGSDRQALALEGLQRTRVAIYQSNLPRSLRSVLSGPERTAVQVISDFVETTQVDSSTVFERVVSDMALVMSKNYSVMDVPGVFKAVVEDTPLPDERSPSSDLDVFVVEEFIRQLRFHGYANSTTQALIEHYQSDVWTWSSDRCFEWTVRFSEGARSAIEQMSVGETSLGFSVEANEGDASMIVSNCEDLMDED